jgi:RNA polymerase primary sigma factor
MRQLKITKQVTNRDTPAFEKYLSEISHKEMISPDEEIDLARRIRQGDRKALEKLVTANLRFVVSVAKQYQNQGLTLQDLVNEGNLGLIKAAERFDETRGFKFISYAVWWIRQSILHAIAVQGRMVRLPLNKIGTLNKINSITMELEQKLEREPTPEELSSAMDIDENDLKDTLKVNARYLSMDAPIGGEDDDYNLYDIIGEENNPLPDESLIKESLLKEINSTLKVLGYRQEEIIKLYYGLNGEHPLTLEEIAEKFELTRERVRQLKESAIRRLKQSTKHMRLKSFLV